MRPTAFHAWWTCTSRRTGEVVISTLASGPLSTRELAKRVCEVEAERKRIDERAYLPVFDHSFDVIEKPLEAAEHWDSVYGPDWERERLAERDVAKE